MALFKSKKEKEEEARKAAEEEKRAEYSKVLKMMEIKVPPKGKPEFAPSKPAEYRQFLAEVKSKPFTLFERAAATAEKILPIKITGSSAAAIDEQLKAAYINATPTGVVSLAALVGIVFSVLIVIGLFLGIGPVFGIFAFGVAGAEQAVGILGIGQTVAVVVLAVAAGGGFPRTVTAGAGGQGIT
ncbi:MAG: hypothetical protein QW761_01750, partial [Candidatus Aenigmatarchaeota archaeon]